MKQKISLFSRKLVVLQTSIALLVFLLCYFFGNVRVDKEVSIPNGATLDNVATILKNNGVIRSNLGFKILAYMQGDQNLLKTGDYRFYGQVSAYRVLDNIVAGRTIEEVFVLIEGWTVKKVVQEMQRTRYLTGNIAKLPAEGSLLPNSYAYRRGTKKQDLIDKMAKAMNDELENNWALRDPSISLYIKNQKEFLTLASLVERETAIKSEKARVAGVFINRLKKGMRLETDPTVIYGLSNGLGELNRKLYIKDLKKKSPWNTYTNYGLPITPIACPSKETLRAIARPERNSYLYFVANGKGGHEFATNFADHQKNINKYIIGKP